MEQFLLVGPSLATPFPFNFFCVAFRTNLWRTTRSKPCAPVCNGPLKSGRNVGEPGSGVKQNIVNTFTNCW